MQAVLWIFKFKSRWSFLFEHIGKSARLLFVFQLWGHLFSHSCQADLLLRSSVSGSCCHLISPQLLHIQQDPGNSYSPFLLARRLLDTLSWCVGWCGNCPGRKFLVSVWCFPSLTTLLLLVTLTICLFILLSVQNSGQLQSFGMTYLLLSIFSPFYPIAFHVPSLSHLAGNVAACRCITPSQVPCQVLHLHGPVLEDAFKEVIIILKVGSRAHSSSLLHRICGIWWSYAFALTSWNSM